MAPPSYRAASPLTLSCQVRNVDNTVGFFYEWTSNCPGICFTKQKYSANVSSQYLHSYDSGVHTCTVYDNLGYTGSANITVNVVGKTMHIEYHIRIQSRVLAVPFLLLLDIGP